MEQNQLSEKEVQSELSEPEVHSENSQNSETQSKTNSQQQEGQSDDPSSELILGKFKSIEDLSNAYLELEKLQGNQSAELGYLRQNSNAINMINHSKELMQNIIYNQDNLKEVSQKYKDYFNDPSFRELFRTAYLAMGSTLDVDKMVNLIEGYVSSRIFAHDKSKAELAETQKAIGSLKFDKNETVTKTPVKKRIDEMSAKELDELLDRLI